MFDLCPMATRADAHGHKRRFTDKDALDKAERASVLRVQ
jgi:hypothetical protein